MLSYKQAVLLESRLPPSCEERMIWCEPKDIEESKLVYIQREVYPKLETAVMKVSRITHTFTL